MAEENLNEKTKRNFEKKEKTRTIKINLLTFIVLFFLLISFDSL